MAAPPADDAPRRLARDLRHHLRFLDAAGLHWLVPGAVFAPGTIEEIAWPAAPAVRPRAPSPPPEAPPPEAPPVRPPPSPPAPEAEELIAESDEGDVVVAESVGAAPLDASPETDELRRAAEAEEAARAAAQRAADDAADAPADDPAQLDLFGGGLDAGASEPPRRSAPKRRPRRPKNADE